VTEQTIRLTIEGTTATVTVDRPQALNALNTSTLDQLEEALASVAQRPELRGLIVTGAGEKAFVAGADIAEMVQLNLEQSLAFAARGHRVFDALERLHCPTLAAVNGFALAGGMELALACDIRIASSKAQFGQSEVCVGSIPAAGGLGATSTTVGSYAGQIIGNAALQSSNASNTASFQSTLLQNIQNKESSLSGVNIDEEMSNLIVYQNAYSASARVISVVDAMYQALEQIQ